MWYSFSASMYIPCQFLWTWWPCSYLSSDVSPTDTFGTRQERYAPECISANMEDSPSANMEDSPQTPRSEQEQPNKMVPVRLIKDLPLDLFLLFLLNC